MFPNTEQIGVVIDQEEAALASSMYQVALDWLPPLKRGSSVMELPPPDENGNINLSIDLVDRVASYGSIALDQLQKQIRVDTSEYSSCVSRSTEDDAVLAKDLDAKLDKEYQDAIKYKSFICSLHAACEQSRARLSRTTTS